ncbi:sodium-dependent glucose transporter 1A [Lingula anatina]|uniref:Sodium-dependent glucose transporter 1A n=1 Tax=Lingula anatina TaxID=7574 RepID=A0A1S3I4Z7_LINAN|nr:sodium-dependent glucose transporter 1A [Lingula anatina]|eukprot:XP_013392906.1 sodium-dependent glucose transporter 1A [Lingula anatina]
MNVSQKMFTKSTESSKGGCCRFSSDRRFTTFSLCAAFFALGGFIAIPGPTLIDLREQVHASVESITYIISGRSGGLILGSIFGGLLFDHMNHHLFLSVLMIFTAVATILVPFTSNLAGLAVCLAVQGVAMGSLDTGGNALCLGLWGQESGPHMQSLHFAFGVGALIAPIVAQPLLSKRLFINETVISLLSNNVSSFVLGGNSTFSPLEINGVSEKTLLVGNLTNRTMNTREMWTETQIMYAYISIAMVAYLCAGLFMVTCIHERTCFSWKRQVKKTEDGPVTREDSLCFKGIFLMILALFYFLYVGLEVSFGALVTTFAFEILHWSKPKAAHLSTVFWGSFAATRGISIGVSKFMGPTIMIITDLALIVVSMLLMAILINTHEIVMWLCTALYGIGMASLFPAGISWAERYIHVTGKSASMFNMGSALGELTFPPLFGHFFHVDGMYFVYISLGGAVGNAVLFIILYILARRQGERYISVPQKGENGETSNQEQTTEL